MKQKDVTADVEVVPESLAGGDVIVEGAGTLSQDDEPRAEPVVEYKGQANVRTITQDQWKGAGVSKQDTTTWSEGNAFAVKKSSLTEEALQILAADGSFIIP